MDRFRQRRRAAAQLALLARRAGAGLLAGTVLLHLLAGALPVTFIVAIGLSLRRLTEAGGDAGRFTGSGWLVVAVVSFVLQQPVASGQLVLSQAVARRVDAYCSTRLMRFALTRAPLRALERDDVVGEVGEASRALEHMAWTPGTATEGGLALIPRYVQLLGAVAIVAVTVHPWAAAAAASVALVNRRGHTAAFFRWGQITRRLAPARRRLSYLRELATGTRAAKEIRTLGLVDWIDQRYAAESRGYLEPLWTARRRLYGLPFGWYTALGLIGAVATMVAVTALPAGGGARLAELTMALQAVVLCIRFGVMFPESDVKMVYGRAAFESLLAFERLAAPTGAPDGRGRAAPAPGTEIAFERVTFCYTPGRPALAGLDLRIPVGTSTAVVGLNGAGKTTLVKLLTGLYQPTEGRVTADGVDLRRYDTDSWQRHFAVTFQDYIRYDLTLRENVAMSAVAHVDDDDGILAELRRVGLDDLVRGLPRGLRTPLSRLDPGGRDLSGGQWQRLALARSLFAVRHGASILVLDEPTAQLDMRGEAEFYDSFLELTSGVTSLIISHRFSSVRRADQIVVIDQGRVLESGSHDELVAHGGRYARMFAAQARRFTTSGTTS